MNMNRRELLASAGAIGVATAATRAQAQARARVIDVHTHMFSHGWVKAVGPPIRPSALATITR
jgi:hypothetical protein